MEKKLEGILQVVFSIAIAAAVLYFSDDIAGLGAYGYAGAFIISLLSSATIIFPAPGWAVVVAMSATLDPLLLGLTAGVGSAIGELTGYAAGEGVRELMDGRIRESRKIEKLVEEYGMAGIFLLALVPNPLFDIAGITAGGLRIPWWRYLAACAAGRVLRYTILAMLGQWTIGLLT